MSRIKYCLGNWKMNQGVNDIEEFQKAFNSYPVNLNVGICPQTMHLERVVSFFKGSGMLVGSQDCAYENSGAFTGETSPKYLKEFGINFTLIGHSERRQFFGETDETCLKKIKKALENDLLVVYCIGESLEQFEAGGTLTVLEKQIKEGLLPLLNEQNAKNIVIAYEPVWAIGTGKTATSEIIKTTLEGIREILGDFKDLSLLYGGSVKPANAKEIAGIDQVDGVLVGGASLDAASFSQIAEAF